MTNSISHKSATLKARRRVPTVLTVPELYTDRRTSDDPSSVTLLTGSEDSQAISASNEAMPARLDADTLPAPQASGLAMPTFDDLHEAASALSPDAANSFPPAQSTVSDEIQPTDDTTAGTTPVEERWFTGEWHRDLSTVGTIIATVMACALVAQAMRPTPTDDQFAGASFAGSDDKVAQQDVEPNTQSETLGSNPSPFASAAGDVVSVQRPAQAMNPNQPRRQQPVQQGTLGDVPSGGLQQMQLQAPRMASEPSSTWNAQGYGDRLPSQPQTFTPTTPGRYTGTQMQGPVMTTASGGMLGSAAGGDFGRNAAQATSNGGGGLSVPVPQASTQPAPNAAINAGPTSADTIQDLGWPTAPQATTTGRQAVGVTPNAMPNPSLPTQQNNPFVAKYPTTTAQPLPIQTSAPPAARVARQPSSFRGNISTSSTHPGSAGVPR